MNIKSITRPYRAFNEDAIVIKDNLFVVIDGATGLHEKSTNISLASQMVNDMQTFLETSPIDDFEQCLLDLARNLQEEY